MSIQKIEPWSVRDLLTNYSKLGVPHFQRGMVWNDDNIASLLESLYFDTPCGNLVLWEKPAQCKTEDFGVRLDKEVVTEKIEYFLIDGQQRTRSIRSVFSKNNKKDCLIDSIPYIWAINLALLEKIQNGGKNTLLCTDSKTSPAIFVKIRDPQHQKIEYLRKISPNSKRKPPEYQFQYNYIPLDYFFEITNNNIQLTNDENLKKLRKVYPTDPVIYDEKEKILKINEENIKDNVIFLKISCEIDDNAEKNINNILIEFRNKLNEMLDHKFSVCKLETNDMSDVIHTFIRINDGGRPVQQEEKALARLVELCPEKAIDNEQKRKGTFTIIRDIFNIIHPESDPDINEQFTRLKENRFGFKLFIRVFILAVNYHTGQTVGSQSMSFSIIHDINDLYDNRDKIQDIWCCTKKVLVATQKLLEKELYFDSLAFLPDTRSLWPIFMLLIKYHDFIEEDCEKDKSFKIKNCYKEYFTYILLHLLLGTGDSEKDIMQFVKVIRNFPLDGNALLKILCSGYDDKKGVFTNIYESSEEIFRLLSISYNSDTKYFIEHTIQKDIKKLMDAWNRIRNFNQCTKLNERLEIANTLNNRYILLLYVLERHLEVEDFYGNSLNILNKDNIRKIPERLSKFTSGKKIAIALSPEKQHIVPYVCLHSSEDALDELYTRRNSKDKANNIGNITYISHNLNHYETGIGEYWLNLQDADPILKHGHIISEDALKKYNKMECAEYINKKKIIIKDGIQFDEWIKTRQKDIATAFVTWIHDINRIKRVLPQELIKHSKQIIPPKYIVSKKNKMEIKFQNYYFDSIMPYVWNDDLSYFKKIIISSLHNEALCQIKVFNEKNIQFLVRKGKGTENIKNYRTIADNELIKTINKLLWALPSQSGNEH